MSTQHCFTIVVSLFLLIASSACSVVRRQEDARKQAKSDASKWAYDRNGERPYPGDVTKSVFAKDNLVAWCIVPFDALERNPRERAEMLKRLGITKVAYDWREKHVAMFEEEILAYKEQGLDFFAFWSWHPDIAPLVKKHGIRPQFWISAPDPISGGPGKKVEGAAKQLLPMVKQIEALGCKIGLYNHGGWCAEPENMVAICQWLRDNANVSNIGIVYNLHHGHGHIEDFSKVLAIMKPYLLCLNLNGMNTAAKPKILPLGQGEHDLQIMQVILQSGYHGPIGILDHREEIDTEESLRENLAGLKSLLIKMEDVSTLSTY